MGKAERKLEMVVDLIVREMDEGKLIMKKKRKGRWVKMMRGKIVLNVDFREPKSILIFVFDFIQW